MKKYAIPASVIIGAMALIMPFEGLMTKAYPDPSNKTIATICYGETQGVSFGDIKTPEQCEDMLRNRLPDYLLPIYKLLPNLPDNRAIAYGSASWNMGVGILTRRSTKCIEKSKSGQCIKEVEIPGTSIVDMERAGNWRGACSRLKLFVFAGGKKYKGLENRRNAEYLECIGSNL